MAKFVMWGSYCKDALEKRTPYREAHSQGAHRAKGKGTAHRARSNSGQYQGIRHLRGRRRKHRTPASRRRSVLAERHLDRIFCLCVESGILSKMF